jgi:aminomethyltransferase
MKERGIPRQHYPIVNASGEVIGEVTSGTQSPVLQNGIGMGYVKADYAKLGTEIFIQVRNRNLKAEIAKTPFIQIK